MLYTHHIQSCFTEAIGAGGVDHAVYEDYLTRAATGLESLRRRRAEGELPVLDLPERRDDLPPLKAIADQLQRECSDVVVLGTGGSSLGGRTLNALADTGHGPQPGAPRLWFMDNIDPDSFTALFGRLQPEKTGALVISKSGGTAETLCQFLALQDWVGTSTGSGLAARGVAICEPGPRPLRQLAEAAGMTVLDHDPRVGGRYSVLSLVGLLPAMIAGLNAETLRRGAAEALRPALDGKAADCPPAQGAALAAALAETRQIKISVLMPYLDRLADLGLWYRQLWAESLGKAGHGTTPVRARGTVDQHSQLQLYLDGPGDKFFTLITGNPAASGPVMATADGVPAYLAGRRMADVLAAEWRATGDTLVKHGCPTRRIEIGVLNERALGALLMHFMLETMLTAEIIGVNAFDQPAVEEGKALARSYLAGPEQQAEAEPAAKLGEEDTA